MTVSFSCLVSSFKIIDTFSASKLCSECQTKVHFIPQLHFSPLKLSPLSKKFSRHYFEIFFIFFPRKKDLTIHANVLQWRPFA